MTRFGNRRRSLTLRRKEGCQADLELRKGSSPRPDEREFKRRFLAQYVDPRQEETRNAARALPEGVEAKRSGRLVTAGTGLEAPRQK